MNVAFEKERQDNVLRYDVGAPFTSLNPADVDFSGSTYVFPLLYSYLFVPNEKGDLAPDLAREWRYDPKTFTWTIRLRRDARFHNERPVTADDAVYSVHTILRKLRPSLYSLIESIYAPTQDTIAIILKRDDPKYLHKFWDMEIISRIKEADFRNRPIGSGPFRFESRKGDREIVLTANQGYFGGRPSLDRVIFYYQPDKEKTWTRLLSGQTDIAQEISPKNYEIMRQYEKTYYFDIYPLDYCTTLLYNTRDPLFSDRRVRLALSHAIDKKYIVDDILKGFGVVASGLLPRGAPYHNPQLKPVSYDPETAFKLLKQAGWSYDDKGRYLRKGKQPFEFVIMVFQEQQTEKRLAAHLQLCLNDLGIKAHVRSLPFRELKRKCYEEIDFQALITELRTKPSDPSCLEACFTSYSLFELRPAQLIYLANREKDLSKREKMFKDIERQICQLQPGTFLFHKTGIDVMSRRFRLPVSFSLAHEGIYRLRYASLRHE